VQRGTKIAVAAIAVVLLVGAGAYALLALQTSDAPAPVSFASDGGSSGVPSVGGTALTADDLEGAYTIDAADSFVGYRVREELAFLSAPNDAVGRTSDVAGSMDVAGTDVSNVRVTADLTTLQSDESMRDERIHTVGLETDAFHEASFALTSPISFDGAPAEGETVQADARGTLTLHGVTNDVTVPAKAKWTSTGIQVIGSLDVTFADYDIEPPRFGPVNVGDDGTIEFRLVFVRS
jgi:polyisoprenoid-binding protein YceI